MDKDSSAEEQALKDFNGKYHNITFSILQTLNDLGGTVVRDYKRVRNSS